MVEVPGGQWSPGVRWPSTRCPLPKDPHLRTVLRQSIEAQKSVTPAVSPLVPADYLEPSESRNLAHSACPRASPG